MFLSPPCGKGDVPCQSFSPSHRPLFFSSFQSFSPHFSLDIALIPFFESKIITARVLTSGTSQVIAFFSSWPFLHKAASPLFVLGPNDIGMPLLAIVFLPCHVSVPLSTQSLGSLLVPFCNFSRSPVLLPYPRSFEFPFEVAILQKMCFPASVPIVFLVWPRHTSLIGQYRPIGPNGVAFVPTTRAPWTLLGVTVCY